MSRTLPKNHEYYQHRDIDIDAEITEESCIALCTYDHAASTGYSTFSDFGDAICLPLSWYSEELAGLESQPQQNPSDDQRRDDLIEAEQALDNLLGEFLEQGYRTGMKERLQKIVNTAPFRFEMVDIFVFPGDRDVFINGYRNPFIDYDAYESVEEAQANAPAFDWDNFEHCEALKEHLWGLAW